MAARVIALLTLLAALAACDKGVLPAPLAAAHAAAATPVPASAAGPAAAVSGVAGSELTAKCGRDARDWYEHKHAWEALANSAGVRIASTYTAHYSAELGRCFIVVNSTTSNTTGSAGERRNLETSTLTDIAANRDIGTADWFGSNAAFDQCQVNGTACLSREEWRALLGRYMGR